MCYSSGGLAIKCYICDCEDDGIAWNSLHQDYNPCFTCQTIITDLKFKDIKGSSEDLELDTEMDDVLYGC